MSRLQTKRADGLRIVAPAPSARVSATTAPASDALILLRIQHLLPVSIQRAELRVAELKQLFLSSHVDVLRAHNFAVKAYLQQLHLQKQVRNVKVVGAEGGGVERCLPFTACAMSSSAADGGYPHKLLTGSFDGLLSLWDVETCRPVTHRHSQEDETTNEAGSGGYGSVRCIVSHPNQPLFLTSTMYDRSMRVWRVGSGTGDVATDDVVGDEESASAAAQSPSPSLSLVAAIPLSGDSAPEDEDERGKRFMVRGLAVDPTGSLLSAVGDGAEAVSVWDIRRSCSDGGTPSCKLFTQTGGYERVGSIRCVQFHPDGALLSTADGGGRVVTWDLRSGKVAFHTTALRTGGHMGAATALAWSPCGVRFASGGSDAVVHLWDARKLQKVAAGGSGGGSTVPLQRMVGHEDVITSLSFRSCPPTLFGENQGGVSVLGRIHPVGIVTTSLDRTVRLWDINYGVCANTLHTAEPVRGHSWVSGGLLDGSLVTIGHSKSWFMWGCGEAGVVQVAETEDTIVTSGRAGVEGQTAEEDDDDEEEDEMQQLKRLSSLSLDDSDSEEEDEMALLRQ